MAEINSFGETLRLARERRGLSQEEAAKSLCLNVEVINALECEQFDKLPSAVFVRGYIKNYANLLRLTINEPSRESTRSVSTSVSHPQEAKHFELLPLLGRIFLKLLNYIVIITLAALVFIWWHERHHAIEKNDTTRSIISMSVEENPFPREKKSNERLLPLVKKQELMRGIFPGWPL